MHFLLLFLNFIVIGEAARGVAPHLKTLYENVDGNFGCLDKSKTIPFELVNDDYCDCPDGSDEPGTSACAQGSFYCVNEGHVGRRLPSSRVGDSICDCCDGSDEHNNGNNESNTDCPDTCEEVGRAHRARQERLARTRADGNRIRQQRIEQAKDLREQLSNQLYTEKANVGKIQASIETQEAIRDRLEVLEKARLRVFNEEQESLRKIREQKELELIQSEFDALDLNKDEFLSRDEVEAAVRFFDVDGDNEVSEDEADIALDGLDSITMDDFPEKYREAMHNALGQEDAYLRKYYKDHLPHEDREFNEDFDDDLGGSHRDLHPRGNSKPDYDDETKKAVDEAQRARDDLRSLQDELRAKEDLIKSIETDLNTDFGQDGEYFALRHKCFEFEDQPFVYKLCLFDSVTQIEGEKSSMGTKLGQFEAWVQESDQIIMLYAQGTKCWNGPDRSTKIIVQCGLDDRLIDFSEPSKCEYEGILETPSACTPLKTHVRDEL